MRSGQGEGVRSCEQLCGPRSRLGCSTNTRGGGQISTHCRFVGALRKRRQQAEPEEQRGPRARPRPRAPSLLLKACRVNAQQASRDTPRTARGSQVCGRRAISPVLFRGAASQWLPGPTARAGPQPHTRDAPRCHVGGAAAEEAPSLFLAFPWAVEFVLIAVCVRRRFVFASGEQPSRQASL